jgi:hypothetical protein
MQAFLHAFAATPSSGAPFPLAPLYLVPRSHECPLLPPHTPHNQNRPKGDRIAEQRAPPGKPCSALPDEGTEPEGAMFGAAGTGPVDVAEVSTNAALEEICLRGSGLCVMAVLDTRSPDFESQLGEVKNVAGRWSKQPLKFFWVDGPRQVRFPPVPPGASIVCAAFVAFRELQD